MSLLGGTYGHQPLPWVVKILWLLLAFYYYVLILIIYFLVGIWGCYVGCVFVGSGSLFSILLLCRTMNMACCMAMTLISSNVCLMLILGILNII